MGLRASLPLRSEEAASEVERLHRELRGVTKAPHPKNKALIYFAKDPH